MCDIIYNSTVICSNQGNHTGQLHVKFKGIPDVLVQSRTFISDNDTCKTEIADSVHINEG